MLSQLIKLIARLLNIFVKNGMVHGNINSDVIKLKIKQVENHPDVITDLRIVDCDFSYKYGKNQHTYFALDNKLAVKSLPPEMVHNLKMYYIN